MNDSKQPRPGTIKALGIRAYLDENYPHRGGAERFEKMVAADLTDEEIGLYFKRSRQTINGWRNLMEDESDGHNE